MKEEQRIAMFEERIAALKSEGYIGKKCTISVLKANLMACVIAGPIAIICIIIYMATKSPKWGEPLLQLDFIFCLAFIASIFIHEVLHGITWAMFCKGRWRSIHIGVMWKQLTPFCCCVEPLRFWPYIIGGLMPLLVLGLGLFGCALMTQNTMLLGVSLINILAAGGDTTIALMLLKHKHAVIIDHPTKCGFWAYAKPQNTDIKQVKNRNEA